MQLLVNLGLLLRPLPRVVKPLYRVCTLSHPSRLRIHTQTSLQSRKKAPSFEPSPQQQEIVELSRKQNVVVSARPGSGKPATAEAIVVANPDKQVGVFTYSRELQQSTHKRLRKYGNCRVFTFHGMAGKLFNTVVKDDMELWEQRRRVLLTKQPPLWDHTPFDSIVLDEFQDCTELIFWLTSCFILANQRVAEGEAARLVVLGDERQSIYSFHDADSRYLTRAPELLTPITPYPWARMSLSQSFRLSHPQTRFINDVLLGGEPYIVGSKAGPKPIVVRCNPYDSRQLIPELIHLIELYGAKNTAIIAPQIRNNRPLSRLVNALSKSGVRIDVPRSDEAASDHKVTRNKLSVSTIHQFKGSERDLIILFGIDSSFFKYMGRDLPDDRCPNEIFVAGTRAAKQLMLIHDESQNLMPFVSVEALYKTCEIVNLTENQADIRPPDAPGRPLELGLTLPRSTSVQDMARYIPDEVLDDIVNDHLDVRRYSLSLPDIDMETVVKSGLGNKFYEAVGDLNGLVVAASCELEVAGTLKTLGIDDDAVINTMPPIESPQHAP
ncbi:hypothetical protein FDECE_1 [Fusarium decemcellulare]|nr:hypothetical protein FDECE_1 [Fusarium decemcellulare]